MDAWTIMDMSTKVKHILSFLAGCALIAVAVIFPPSAPIVGPLAVKLMGATAGAVLLTAVKVEKILGDGK